MDFDFEIQFLEKHNAFSIEPSSGKTIFQYFIEKNIFKTS